MDFPLNFLQSPTNLQIEKRFRGDLNPWHMVLEATRPAWRKHQEKVMQELEFRQAQVPGVETPGT